MLEALESLQKGGLLRGKSLVIFRLLVEQLQAVMRMKAFALSLSDEACV